MESENGGLVLQPLEKRDRRLKIEWPDRKELLGGRDEYVNKHRGEEKDNLKKLFPNRSDKRIGQLEKICLGARYMIEQLQRISPIPLEVPIEIVEQNNNKNFGIMSASQHDNERGQLDRAIFNINLFLWDEALEAYIGKKRIFVDSLSLSVKDKVWIGDAKEIVEERNGKVVEYLEQVGMSSTVHEFAHLLYMQQSNNEVFRTIKTNEPEKGQHRRSKVWGLVQALNTPVRSQEDMDDYLALDIETRARLWELDFLKHCFPESVEIPSIRADLKIGKDVRQKKKEEGIRSTEFSANEVQKQLLREYINKRMEEKKTA